jgi:transcriptional antiterminator NusG
MSDLNTIVVNEFVPGTSLSPADGMNWYVVHAYSGMEKAVERNITERINRAGMQSKFGRFLVPTEEVVEVKTARRKQPSAGSFQAMFWSKWPWTMKAGTWSNIPTR